MEKSVNFCMKALEIKTTPTNLTILVLVIVMVQVCVLFLQTIGDSKLVKFWSTMNSFVIVVHIVVMVRAWWGTLWIVCHFVDSHFYFRNTVLVVNFWMMIIWMLHLTPWVSFKSESKFKDGKWFCGVVCLERLFFVCLHFLMPCCKENLWPSSTYHYMKPFKRQCALRKKRMKFNSQQMKHCYNILYG